MITSRFTRVSNAVFVLTQMALLTWQAQPAWCALLLLVELLQGLIPPATAWVTKSLFDLLGQTVQQGVVSHLPATLFPLLLAQAGLTVFGQLCLPVSRFFNGELGRSVTWITQARIYSKLAHIHGLAPFENSQLHDNINLATQGGQYGPHHALLLFTTLVRSSITLATFLGLLIAFNPLLAVLVGMVSLPQVYVQLQLSRQRVNLVVHTSSEQRRVWFYEMVLSGIDFAKELRLFTLADYMLRAWERTIVSIHHAQRQQQRRELSVQSGLAVFASLVNGCAVIIVIMRAFQGQLSLGDVVFYLSAVASMQAASYEMTLTLASLHESVLFYRHYTQLLALPQPLSLANSPQAVPRLTTGIELRNVSFRYSGDHPWVLQNVNLVIPVGQCVALVGLNGAGKTTLVKLLARLYDPTEGQILWDDVDIRQFDPEEYRQQLGAIFQDFVQYDLTAYDNIALGNVHDYDNQTRVYEAAQKAGIHDAIKRLPAGYDTLLSRWLSDKSDAPGAELSGGEWQKVALARMLMRDADLLILDEPTAALDPQAEYDMFQQFTALVHERTTLLISHRFSTVQMADAIAVLEDGQITEFGTHHELMTRNGSYAKLYTMQAQQYQQRDAQPQAPWPQDLTSATKSATEQPA